MDGQVPASLAAVAPGGRKNSRLLLRALARDKLALLAACFVSLIILLSIIWPIVSPFEVSGRDFDNALLPPLSQANGQLYLFGTDALGRDLFTRIMYGGRISMSVAVAVTLVSGTAGVVLGVLAGYFRGFLDTVIMRVVDVFMALPTIFFVLLALYLVGPSTLNMVLVMSVARWMLYGRVVRGLTLSLREQTFILATNAIGASNLRVMFRHLIPNMLSTVFTLATIDIAGVILLESSISFLGMGLQPPAVSWGLLISDGRKYMLDAWWLITVPGVFIFLTCLSINIFGLWLRMVNDPVHRQRYLRRRMKGDRETRVPTTSSKSIGSFR